MTDLADFLKGLVDALSKEVAALQKEIEIAVAAKDAACLREMYDRLDVIRKQSGAKIAEVMRVIQQSVARARADDNA